MLIEDPRIVLVEFYRWASTGEPGKIYYPSADTTSRARGSTLKSVQMSDDEAAFVDLILCQLKQLDPDVHAVIEKSFGYGKSARWLSLHGYGSRATVDRRIAEGLQFVRGALVGASR